VQWEVCCRAGGVENSASPAQGSVTGGLIKVNQFL